MSAAVRGRRAGSHREGAFSGRRRGWQVFVLGLVFRVQAQLLGLGALTSLFKVDMLNTMGLSMVLASYVWQWNETRVVRVAWLAALLSGIAMLTPVVRDVGWLAALPDPLEAYLRPAGGYAAFPLFAWTGFLLAGAIAGDLVDWARGSPARDARLQTALVLAAGAGFVLAWTASLAPSIYPSAGFWTDSPTFFFIRLSLVTLLIPTARVLEWLLPTAVLRPLTTMGRSSLFVYWIHVEMVYGVIAEPLKAQLPLAYTLASTFALTFVLYLIVRLKNHYLAEHELRGPWRLLAPVIR